MYLDWTLGDFEECIFILLAICVNLVGITVNCKNSESYGILGFFYIVIRFIKIFVIDIGHNFYKI